MDVSNSHDVVNAVVPTLALPFAAIAFFLNALVTWVASLLGLKLRWDGPRDLLVRLLSPRVLIAGVLLNASVVGSVYGWHYVHELPASLATVKGINADLGRRSGPVGIDRTYTDLVKRTNEIDVRPGGSRLESIGFSQLWRVKAGSGIWGAASVSGSSVFVGSNDGYVYEFDQSDGRLVRRFFIGTLVSPDPIVWKNRLFVGEGNHDTHGARLYAFDLKSGDFLGAFETAGHTEGTPALVHDATTGEDHLLFSAGRDGVYSIDPVTLNRQWHFTGGHTDADPREKGGRVYFSTGVEKGHAHDKPAAYAVDLRSGAQIWRAELPASGWMPAVFVDNQVCFGAGEIDSTSAVGGLSCYDLATGQGGHTVTLNAPVLSMPLRVNDQVIVGNRDGQLCALQFPQGVRRWCHATKGEAWASPTYFEPGALIYPSAKEGLLAFDLNSDRVLAQWRPTPAEGEWETTHARATLAPGGDQLFLTDSAGNLRKIAVRFETTSVRPPGEPAPGSSAGK